MSTQNLEIGKTWVVAMLMSYGRKSGFIISNAQFNQAEGDSENGLQTLHFRSGKTLRDAKFKKEDLERCSVDFRARDMLTNQIIKLVKSI